MHIPPGYELNDDDNYKIVYGERFYSISGSLVGEAMGFAGLTVKQLRECHSSFVFRKITGPKTPEQKKKQSKQFVDKYIPNPSKEIYLKFEETFLRDDNFGLWIFRSNLKINMRLVMMTIF